VDEPAESLAAERVTLEDMRMRFKWGNVRMRVNVCQMRCASGIVEMMEDWGLFLQ
jgi:hypothetical protein